MSRHTVHSLHRRTTHSNHAFHTTRVPSHAHTTTRHRQRHHQRRTLHKHFTEYEASCRKFLCWVMDFTRPGTGDSWLPFLLPFCFLLLRFLPEGMAAVAERHTQERRGKIDKQKRPTRALAGAACDLGHTRAHVCAACSGAVDVKPPTYTQHKRVHQQDMLRGCDRNDVQDRVPW